MSHRARVVILATGGTIAGVAASMTDPGYRSARVSLRQLLDAVPGLDERAEIQAEQISSIGSQSMTDEVWLRLAARVNEVLGSPEVDGVVVTHGTDTMEETAYFLHLVVRSDKPVVMTGSMRPSTALSADGPLNLYNAVAVAASPEATDHGVMVVINDLIHSAREVIKSSTTSVQTFISPVGGQLGGVNYGKITYYQPVVGLHTHRSELSVQGVTELPRVDVVYAHENADGAMVHAAAQAGARGVVVAGVGNGNMTEAMTAALAEVARSGVVCVRSSRVPTGYVDRNIEVDDDRHGFVASYKLNPQKARVLLRLALLRTADPGEIQGMFGRY